MLKNFRILTINPGSTSTVVAVFRNEELQIQCNLSHSSLELSSYDKISDQYEFRSQVVLDFLKNNNIKLNSFDAIVGRGGEIKPIKSGTYRINELMIEDLKERPRVEHASNLGAIIAHKLAQKINKPAFIVDGISVDEFDPLARISGIPEIEKESLTHALSLKAAARRAARDLNKNYQDLNLVVIHLGGGISVSAHYKGRLIDSNCATTDGPFSPERSGSLPTRQLVKMCYSGKYSEEEMLKKINGRGGLVAYLGTNNTLEIEERISNGDKKAELIYKAMAYQIAKEIGGKAAVLKGEVDAIVFTGNLLRGKGALGNTFLDWIKERVQFIAPIIVYPGSDELKAMARGAIRVLRGTEKAEEYS